MTDKKYRSKQSLLLLGKIGIILFIIYSRWYSETYGDNRFMLYGTVLFASVFVLMDIILRGGKIQFPKKRSEFILMCLAFLVYCFITGIFVSRDRGAFLSAMQTFLSTLVVCFDAWYISEREDSYEWLLSAIFVAALLCAGQTLLFGFAKVTSKYTRVALSADNNTNHLGFTMVAGLCALVARGKSSDKGFLGRLLISIVFLYVIVLSGSRKNLIAGVMYFAIWLYIYLRDSRHERLDKVRLLNYIVLAVGVGFVIYYVINLFSSTSAYTRMMQLLTEGDDNVRVQLYRDAIIFWKAHPLFGIGFHQYRIWSQYGIYSHSSYAEILSCTGLVGTLLFFIPVLRKTVFLLKRSIYRDYKMEWYSFRICLLMLAVEFFIGIGQIWIYDTLHMLMFIYIFGKSILLDEKVKSEVSNDELYG